MLSSSQEKRLGDLLERALTLPPEERSHFIAESCKHAEELQDRLKTLVQAAEHAPSFFEELGGILPTRPTTRPALEADDIFAHFRIIRQLGAGGMGIVYLAEDLRLGRRLALKFLPPYLTNDPEARQRFLNEARLAAKLNHPNIATIYESGEASDHIYIAMEYVQGESLKERLKDGAMPITEVTNMLRQIGKGLHEAHLRGIVHRDIKPGNIMITESGRIKIMDFGLAKQGDGESLTRTGSTLGTTAYMSPEQARGEKLDTRTDIWSFGIVLYEMLTGERPFKGANEQAVIYSILNARPQAINKLRSGVPEQLLSICNYTLQKDRRRRAADAAFILDQLDPSTSKQKAIPLVRHSRPTLTRLTYAALIFALAILGLLMWTINSTNSSIPFESIAILPIQNLTGDSENDFLADGVLETLISEFSRVQDLKVIARSSVLQYKKASKPAPVIGQELDVERLLESTLLTSIDSLRLTTRLVDVSTGNVLNSFSHTGPKNDPYGFQRKVALDLLANVTNLDFEASRNLRGLSHNVSPEAERLHLKGNFYLSKSMSPEQATTDWAHAEEYYLAAAQMDSLYADAVAGYALMRVLRTLFDEQTDTTALDWANRALALDPQNAKAHLSLGLYSELQEFDWEKAKYHFEKAIESEPGNLLALFEYGALNGRIGNFDVLAEVSERMTSIDPVSNRTLGLQRTAFLLNKEYDRLLNAANEMLELDSTSAIAFHFRGKAFQGMEMYPEAEAAYARSFELNNSKYIGPSVGCMYANSGQPDKALEVIETFKTVEDKIVCHRCMFSIYGCLGDEANTLYWMERLIHERPKLGFFVAEHFLLLKDDPRYQKLLKTANLAQYQDDWLERAGK